MTEMRLADHDLASLVPEWIDWATAAEQLGVTVAKVRTMVKDHELADAVPTPGAGPAIPADLIQDREPVKGLPGLLTVLHDNGYGEITTEIRSAKDAGPFYLAEDYHQGYLHKNPGGYCNHGPYGCSLSDRAIQEAKESRLAITNLRLPETESAHEA